MKKKYLKFDSHGTPFYVPGMATRRHRSHRFGSAAYKTGTSDDDDEDDEDEDDEEDLSKEERLMLRRIKKTVERKMRSHAKKAGAPMSDEAIGLAIAKHFGDVKIDALRSFDFEASKAALTTLAGKFEAMEQNREEAGPAQKRTLYTILNEKVEDMEKLFKDKKQGAEISFNVRALKPVMTTGNVVASEEIPEDILNSFTVGEFVGKRYGTQFIYDIAGRTVVSSISEYKTWLEEGAIDGAFAIVAESALKPLMSADVVRNVSKVKKVAAKYVVTEETVKFRQEIYNIITGLIKDKMVRDFNAILTTDLNAQAAGYIGTTLDDTVVAPNDYDAIAAVAAQIETLNFAPDVIVLHPQDKWRMRIAKDSDNRYIFPVTIDNGIASVMGMRIVTSTYQTPGSFTLGEAGLFKIEEETMKVRIGYGLTTTAAGGNVTSAEFDLDYNRFRIIVETFFRDYIATNHLGSFVKASFATVKAALLKP